MLKEERIYYRSGDLKIEGLYADAGAGRGVVVSHPHPLMGGDMKNNVVESLVLVFNESGYSTLRFNFRGAGRSEGTHDEGEGEKLDLEGAVSFMQERGAADISLAGYSFGAWVTFNYLQNRRATGSVILVAPPVSVYSFPKEALVGKIDLIVCGDKDPFCKAEDVAPFAKEVQSPLVLIPRTDHFFFGKEDQLIKIVGEYLDSV